MAKINLLPWRDRLREKRKKEFIEASALAAVLGGLIIFIWSTSLGLQISHQIERNDRLKSEIEKLDKEIEEVQSLEKKRDVLVSRMKIIQGLQTNRPYIVHVFDELVKTLPEGVYYKSINRTEGNLKISGIGDSNESISALMRRLEASPWFKAPLLSGVQNQKMVINPKDKDSKSMNISTFNLTVSEEAPPNGPGSKKESAK